MSITGTTTTVTIHTYASRGLGSVNTCWIEGDTGIVVIDGQRLLSDARNVLGAVAKTGKPVEALVITHHHPDHIGGSAAFVKAFPRAKVLAGQSTIDSIRNDEGGLIALAHQYLGSDFEIAEPLSVLPENQAVTLAGLTFEVRQIGPGEASSMNVLYLAPARALFAADVVCNAMTPFLAEQRTGPWLKQLDWIAGAFPDTRTVYPGHGAPAALETLIASTRTYLTTVRDLVRSRQGRSVQLTPDLRSEIIGAIEARYPGYVPVAAIPDALGMNVDGVWAELQRERRQEVARPKEDSMAAPLTTWEVKELVYSWFKKLTDKVPAEELTAMLSGQSLEMQFPDDTLRNHAEFRGWLTKVTSLFFDQVHDVLFLDVSLDGERAEVNLVVNWQARTWTPPAAYSAVTRFNVHQHWVVVRDRASGRPVILRYMVGQFDDIKG